MQITINTQEEHPDTLRILAELLSQMSSTQPISNTEQISTEQRMTGQDQSDVSIESNLDLFSKQQETNTNPYQIPNLFEDDMNSQQSEEQTQSENSGMVAFNNLFDNYNVDDEKKQEQKPTQQSSDDSSENRIVFY